ncbi:VanZ family protein [Bacillus sp. CGMCC 1.16607]|uniref:VanZ family protein n=1 Tax=Bacillus sp. CGMCC 1.16607 TaxID=3351842 RepID=UPI0036347F43
MYAINLFEVGLTIIVIYSIYDFIKNKDKDLKNRLIIISFWIYFCYSVQEIFGHINVPPRLSYYNVQLAPFLYIKYILSKMDFISRIIDSSWIFLTIKDLLKTFLLTFPLGVYIQLIFDIKHFKRGLIVIASTSLILEGLEFMFAYTGVIDSGIFQTDVIILYTLGGIAGFYFYRFYLKMVRVVQTR